MTSSNSKQKNIVHNLNWKVVLYIVVLTVAVGITGINLAAYVDLQTRVSTIQNMLVRAFYSEYYALQRDTDFIICMVPSEGTNYYALGNGTDGTLLWWNTNKTAVQAAAIGNLTSGGSVYVKDQTFDTLITIPANVVVIEDYQGRLDYYGNNALWWNGQNRTDAIANPVGTVSYTIDMSGPTYRMKNCSSGQIDFQSANFSQVMTYALGNYTSTHCISILIKAGFYTVSSTIPINMTAPSWGGGTASIQGEGNYLTTLQLANSANCNMFEIQGGVLPYFAHMTLLGNNAHQTVASSAFVQTGSVDRGVDCTFFDIWFAYWKGPALNLTRGWDHMILRCQFESSDTYGIVFDNHGAGTVFATTTVSECYFSGNGGGIQGVYVTNVTRNVNIENNIFFHCHGKPCIVPAGEFWTILGNSFYDIYMPIQFLGNNYYDNIVISSNNIKWFWNYGIYNNGTRTTHDVLIEANQFVPVPTASSPVTAIVAGNSSGTKIVNNIINASAKALSGYAIDISDSSCINPEITGNTFEGTFSSGIINKGLNPAIIKCNMGFVTENSGSTINATATTFSFLHGLSGTPSYGHGGVWCSFNSTAVTNYVWTANATAITVTIAGTNLDAIIACYWSAQYVP